MMAEVVTDVLYCQYMNLYVHGKPKNADMLTLLPGKSVWTFPCMRCACFELPTC